MSRIEENAKLKFKPDMAMKVNAIECAKVKFLEDISRSLAIIASDYEPAEPEQDPCDEADLYVRDHLLIEWLLSDIGRSRARYDHDTEQIYEDWMEWLSKKEAQHE